MTAASDLSFIQAIVLLTFKTEFLSINPLESLILLSLLLLLVGETLKFVTLIKSPRL